MAGPLPVRPIVVAAVVVAMATLAGCSGDRGTTTVSAPGDSIATPVPTSPSQLRSGPPTAAPPGPTYRRGTAKGIYLNVMPGENGDEDDVLDPRYRVRGRVALDGGDIEIGGLGTMHAVSIVGAGDGRVDRWVSITGTGRDDFVMSDPNGTSVGASGFLCDGRRCIFSMAFAPHHLGRRTATLTVGDAPYVLTGVGIRPATDEGPPPEEAGPSPPSASASTSASAETGED